MRKVTRFVGMDVHAETILEYQPDQPSMKPTSAPAPFTSPEARNTEHERKVTRASVRACRVVPYQRTRFQLRRPSERESGVCCKPLLGGSSPTGGGP
jgi:hypothetical protein